MTYTKTDIRENTAQLIRGMESFVKTKYLDLGIENEADRWHRGPADYYSNEICKIESEARKCPNVMILWWIGGGYGWREPIKDVITNFLFDRQIKGKEIVLETEESSGELQRQFLYYYLQWKHLKTLLNKNLPQTKRDFNYGLIMNVCEQENNTIIRKMIDEIDNIFDLSNVDKCNKKTFTAVCYIIYKAEDRNEKTTKKTSSILTKGKNGINPKVPFPKFLEIMANSFLRDTPKCMDANKGAEAMESIEKEKLDAIKKIVKDALENIKFENLNKKQKYLINGIRAYK